MEVQFRSATLRPDGTVEVTGPFSLDPGEPDETCSGGLLPRPGLHQGRRRRALVAWRDRMDRNRLVVG